MPTTRFGVPAFLLKLLSESQRPLVALGLVSSSARLWLTKEAKLWQTVSCLCFAARWSVLTYEMPKQSPLPTKEEENGDSNIQVELVCGHV